MTVPKHVLLILPADKGFELLSGKLLGVKPAWLFKQIEAQYNRLKTMYLELTLDLFLDPEWCDFDQDQLDYLWKCTYITRLNLHIEHYTHYGPKERRAVVRMIRECKRWRERRRSKHLSPS